MKRLTKHFILLVTLVATVIGTNAQDWEWKNPLPQGNRINDIHAFDQNNAIAVGAEGAIMETSDGGNSWQFSRLDTYEWLYSVHFVDDNVGYIAHGDGKVSKTTNGGLDWNFVTSPSTYAIFSIWALSPTDVICLRSDGSIYKSDDGGDSWNHITNPGSGYGDLNKVYFIDGTTGFIVGGKSSSDRSEIFKTTDGGNTWNTVSSPVNYELTDITFTSSTTGYIVGGNGTILKSTDGGDSWSLYWNSGANYADYTSSAIYRYFESVKFYDANNGIAAGENGIYYTSDAGNTWESGYYSYGDDVRALFINGSNSAIGLGDEGMIIRTNSKGENWEKEGDYNTNIFHGMSFSGNVGYAVADGGYILKTNDDGSTWAQLGISGYFRSVLALSANNVVMAGSSVYTSNDGGDSWELESIDGSGYIHGLHSPGGSDYVFGVGTNTVIKSTDGGDTWTNMTSPYENTLQDVFFTDENNGVAVGGDWSLAKIFRTTNGGSSWSEIASPIDNKRLYGVTFVSDQVGFICGEDTTLLRTSNGGETWTKVVIANELLSSIGRSLRSIHFIDSNNGVAVGNSGIVLITTDGGDTWDIDTTVPSKTYFYDAHYSRDRLIACGMYGRIMLRAVDVVVLDEPPLVTTDAISAITENSATSGGNVTSDGGAAVTARGVVWSTSENPTVGSNDGITTDGDGTGEFTSSITGLTANTTYYVRAYATNNEGTGYGNEVQFTTEDEASTTVPTLTTTTVTNITQTTASSGGAITADGGADITAKGVVWSTTTNPTLSTNSGYTTNGTGTAEFNSDLTGLTANTTYYVRAYATNSEGTAYGNQVTFTTLEEASGQVYASLPYNEDFDSDWIDSESTRDAPSTYWVNNPATGGSSWRRNDDGVASGAWGTSSGEYSPAGANGTLHSARFHSFGVSSGETGILDLHVDFSTLSGDIGLSFWYINTSGDDTLNVYLSTDGGQTFGEILHTVGVAEAWQQEVVELGSLTSVQGVVRFEAVSDYGWTDIGFDEVFVGIVTSNTIPTVTTSTISDITQTTATSGGNVTSDGGAAVTARGVVWSTSENPTLDDNEGEASSGTGTGEFFVDLLNLTPSTTYYVRAYATNSEGTAYGDQVNFSTLAVSVDAQSLASKVELYPNPFANNLALESTVPVERVELITITGQRIMEERVNGEQSITLNTSAVKAGAYILRVTTTAGDVTSIRVLRQ